MVGEEEAGMSLLEYDEVVVKLRGAVVESVDICTIK